jgi:hypothetical protein
MSALKIKQALGNISNPNTGKVNNSASSFTSKMAISTPINITNKKGIEKLNLINEDFVLLENSFENFQKVYERFQTVLADVENTVNSSEASTDPDEDQEPKHKIYKYADIPFGPSLYKTTRIVFNSKFDDLNICSSVRDELNRSNAILEENIIVSEKFLSGFKSVLSKLSESFSYTSLNNFSHSMINPELEEKFGILLFYIANLAKSGKIKNKEWNEIMKSNTPASMSNSTVVNSLLGFQPEIEKIYMKNFSSILSFGNKYCSFYSDEYIKIYSNSLINLIKDLSKILHFVEHGSLETFDLNLDFESELLGSIGGPDVHKYFVHYDSHLGRAGALPSRLKKVLKSKRKSSPISPKKPTQIDSFTKLLDSREEKKADFSKLCLSNQLDINLDFLRKFFSPFGNFLDNFLRDENEIQSNKHTITPSSCQNDQTFDDFLQSIDSWPMFNANLVLFFEDTMFKKLFDNIYTHLVNSIWFCGNSIDNVKNGSPQISLEHLKFPYMLSFRDGAILLNIQEGNVSSVPMTLFMDDFCHTPFCSMLVLLGLCYFQQKNPETVEERYFHEHITSNLNPTISNLVIIKLVDFVLYVANESLRKNDTKNFTNFVVTDIDSFNETMPHVFSSVRLIEASKIDLMHRSVVIDNQNDIHSNSMWTINFFFNFAINSVPLSTFLGGENLDKSLSKILKMMYDKNYFRSDCLRTASGKHLNENLFSRFQNQAKIPESKRKNLLDLLLWIHDFEINTCHIYSYDQFTNQSLLTNLTLVSSDQLERIEKLGEKKCVNRNFFCNSINNIRNNKQVQTKYVISKYKIENLVELDSSQIGLVQAYNLFLVNNDKPINEFKLIHHLEDLYIVKCNVNLGYLLCLKKSFDDEFGCWNLFNHTSEKESFIKANHLSTIPNEPIDEYTCNKRLNIDPQIIAIDKSQEYVDLNIFFQIENNAKIFKKKMMDCKYKYYLDSQLRFDSFTVDPVPHSVVANFPPTVCIETGSGRGRPQSKPPKKKTKIAFRTFVEKDIEINPIETIEPPKEIKKTVNENFNNSLLINITNKNMEKLREILIKTETIILESCRLIKTNAELKLLEMIALKHFKTYPHLYIMCNEISGLTPFYSYFEDVYANNFCIKIEEMEKLLKSTHSFSDHILKFKEHYSFFCLRSLPMHKFGNIIKIDRGSCFFHMMAIYIVHSQLKLAGDPAYDQINV